MRAGSWRVIGGLVGVLVIVVAAGALLLPRGAPAPRAGPGEAPPTPNASVPLPTPTASMPPPTPTASVPPVAQAEVNPLRGARWYVDPRANAKMQADLWRADRPADAAQMDKIATQPQADWFGDWNADIGTAVAARVATIAGAGAVPLLVAYNIPHRDCGSYSAGGAAAAAAYKAWIRAFAAGLGSGPAVVILEPDALAGMDCLPADGQQERMALIADAITALKAQPTIRVYVDGGHSNWKPAPEMATRLTTAGVAAADGFALNVSNFIRTEDLIRYGRDLAGRLGGKHFVIDTSRNGLGATPDNQWCNPDGRALGQAPTADTGDPLVDAFLWIKRPGESDGTCNGGPPAGQWWPEYALGLAQRASTP